MDEGLFRLGDLRGDESGSGLEDGGVVAEGRRDDPVFMGRSVHSGTSELGRLRGV